jgi:hypothetical protein
MKEEIEAVLKELAANREMNTTYGGAAVVQAAVIVELRKLRAAVEEANKPLPIQIKVRKPRKSKEKLPEIV